MAAGRAAKKDAEEILQTLRSRFEQNMQRHKGVAWAEVRARLEGKPAALASLQQMESTGGEPDVIGVDRQTGELLFCDCSAESPEGRRNVCYDRKGYEKRVKEGLPVAGSALEMAAAMSIEVLTEEQYGQLQALGEFDSKSQSWLKATAEVEHLGGGIFGDRRYGRMFIYHNGPQSFYRARGFRGMLKV